MNKVIRLNSGDFIIGSVSGNLSSPSVTVGNPVMLLTLPEGIVFWPVLDVLSDDKAITISSESIAFMMNPSEDLNTKYIQKVTGIELPSKKLVGV